YRNDASSAVRRSVAMTPTYRSTTGVRPVLASPAMRRRLRAVAYSHSPSCSRPPRDTGASDER
ncbi:MAG: hypothetical protein ACRDMW_03710, partial [Gaiellaceae bacterium]